MLGPDPSRLMRRCGDGRCRGRGCRWDLRLRFRGHDHGFRDHSRSGDDDDDDWT